MDATELIGYNIVAAKVVNAYATPGALQVIYRFDPADFIGKLLAVGELNGYKWLQFTDKDGETFWVKLDGDNLTYDVTVKATIKKEWWILAAMAVLFILKKRAVT